jgi:RHS repeat-associated protein
MVGLTASRSGGDHWLKPSFGSTKSSSIKFTGKPSDSATELYYFGARWYDPSIGRFTTEDSKTGSRQDSQSLNRYVYARENPLAITDQTGHDWWSGLTSAVSNAASNVVSTVTSAVSAVSNAWDSLPPSYQFGIVVGVTAVATVVTLGAFAPEAAAIDIGSAGALEIGTATAGAAAVADASPELVPDAATITSTIDEGLQSGITKSISNVLDNPNPKLTTSQGAGSWGQNILGPLLKPLGFVEGKVIPTTLGNLKPDFFNPDTGVAIDSKVGSQTVNEFEETQMAKYALAEMTGQISHTLQVLMPNPVLGSVAGPSYTRALEDYGISYIRALF